jgi:hypothetical protein
LKIFANAVYSAFLLLALIATAISPAFASQSAAPTRSTQASDVINWFPPQDQNSVWLYQGYFPDAAPWVAPGVVVKNYLRDNATHQPTKNINFNSPGRYPVAYQINKSLTGKHNLVLEGRLHSDGAYSDCEWSVATETTSLSVRNCADEYPNRHYYGYDARGVSWWTYWGGTKGCPKCSKDAAVQRVAQSLIEVGKRHADLIDAGAGITLAGDDFGGAGAILQSFIFPRIQSLLSVVYARRAVTLLDEWNYTESMYIGLAWGNSVTEMGPTHQYATHDLAKVNFAKVAATGALDNIWYRIDGSTAPVDDGNNTTLHPEFFRQCDELKIGCLGTWNVAINAIAEPGVTIPHVKYPDPNMIVRLDKPMPVFTNFSQNSWAARGYYNLGLSWNTAGITESATSLTLPIKYKANTNMSSDPAKPVANQGHTAITSVTVRHPRVFKIQPGEKISWRFGTQSGYVIADAKGEVTVKNLQLASSDSAYTDLLLSK